MKYMKKRAMRLMLCLCLLAGLVSGCSAPKEKPMGEADTWSVFLYLCGSNLETQMGAAGKNLDEILAADIPDNVNVVIQTGGAEKWRSHDIPNDSINRWLVKDGRLSLLESVPQASMGDQQTFADFLSYGVENYPAEKMCVIVWDHGSGSIDGVANDENYNFDALTLAEMDGALNTVSEQMTDRFELFGFDACLMANYETASTLKPYARYLLASEEIEPSGGWDYGVLFGAISADKSISGGALGKAVCDGYYAKCEAGGKEATATLSVLDLSKLEGVQKAFDAMAGNMKESAVEAKGIQSIAQSAKNSQKYGGTSGEEGYSNMIDLRHFAENAVDVDGSKELIDALDDAIVYKVNGAQKSKSGGLSFYYPSHVEEQQLSEYYANICPSESYREYLKSVYSNIPEEPVKFTDLGSEAEDGSFQIALDESSRNYILSVDFLLLEYSLGMNGDTPVMTGSWFGRDNDMFTSEDGLSFHSNFRGIWLALNGYKLYVTPVEDTEDYIIFTAPISLNGERTNLRFAFIWDDAYENGGYYKLLGAWNGIDPVTGMSDKEITELKPTDKITAYYPYQTLTLGADGLPEYSKVLEREQEVPQGEYVITEEPLEAGDYGYQFVVTDIFGNQHFSYSAWMLMTKTAEELKNNPLPDGEYAALVDMIMESTDSIAEEE